MNFLKLITGWKLYALIGAVSLSMGFYGGMRWEKGANLAEAEEALQALSEQAQTALVTLGSAWEVEAAKAQVKVEEWNLQQQIDEALLIKLLKGQDEIRRGFNELNAEITVLTDFGACKLSPDAIRLLRAASEKAGSPSVPNN